MEIKDQELIFTVMGGMTYSLQNRPPFWKSETPFFWDTSKEGSKDGKHLPLETFPLIEDFEVLLEKMEIVPEGDQRKKHCPFGYHIYFSSPQRGYIASFPWWDHAERDLRREDFSFPLGTADQPYSDLEQGWEILIFTDDHFVYVVEGDFDRVLVDHYYHTWFKVSVEKYLYQWQKAIQICHQFSNEL